MLSTRVRASDAASAVRALLISRRATEEQAVAKDAWCRSLSAALADFDNLDRLSDALSFAAGRRWTEHLLPKGLHWSPHYRVDFIIAVGGDAQVRDALREFGEVVTLESE
jgi:hypothetical protein